MKTNRIIVVAAALVFGIGCGNPDKRVADESPATNPQLADQQIPPAETISDSTTHQLTGTIKDHDPVKPRPQDKPDWDKKIIKHATLSFEVKNFKAYSIKLREQVRTLGGYIAQEEQTESNYKVENTISIKIPVDQFDNGVDLFTREIPKLDQQKITSQDVSTEFVDTRSRIEAKKQMRQRYMDLLQQAKNMEDILNVQSHVNGIQEEIEAASGRIQYLGHASAFSTIQISFYQVLNAAAKDDAQPGFGNRLTGAFRSGSAWIIDLIVGLISIWPLLIMIMLLWIVYRNYRSSRPKVATTVEGKAS